jgi:hypothetical protein
VRCSERRLASALVRCPLLQSSQPSIDVVVAALVNELSALPNEVVLVLDDFHVIEAREVHDAMVLPHEFIRVAAVPFGLALAWLGYALWSDRRASASQRVLTTGRAELRQPALVDSRSR